MSLHLGFVGSQPEEPRPVVVLVRRSPAHPPGLQAPPPCRHPAPKHRHAPAPPPLRPRPPPVFAPPPGFAPPQLVFAPPPPILAPPVFAPRPALPHSPGRFAPGEVREEGPGGSSCPAHTRGLCPPQAGTVPGPSLDCSRARGCAWQRGRGGQEAPGARGSGRRAFYLTCSQRLTLGLPRCAEASPSCAPARVPAGPR